ncbi:hypothetical protein VTI74DRAFT_859 [Chaetomium olivicolor]
MPVIRNPLRRASAVNIVQNDPQAPPKPIDGMNVFWVLFSLISATALHPLSAAPGFSPDVSRFIRTLPLCSLLDVLRLYSDRFARWELDRGQVSPRAAAQSIATQRLRQGMRRAPPEEGGSRLRAHLTLLYLEAWPRFLANVGMLLAYAKIWGFRGVGWLQALATVCFVIWATVELVLVTAFGIRSRIRDGLFDVDQGLPCRLSALHDGNWGLCCWLLFWGQVLALAGTYMSC